MRARLGLTAGLLLVGAHAASAQGPPRVTAGWGVDTAAAAYSEIGWHVHVAAVFRAWRDFLRARPGTPGADTLWSAAERRAWPAYDLASATGYRGFPATILDIRPASPAQRDTFVVRTLFAAAIGPDHDVKPAALTRVYAVREAGHWRFANALPRLTAGWRRVRVGPITYVFSPAHRFDRARAQRAVHFADSLAAAFGVAQIDSLTCYLAACPEALLRIMGVDWSFGGLGYGYALRADRLLLTGDAAFAESNRHELTHYMLSPLVSGRTHPWSVRAWRAGWAAPRGCRFRA